MLVTSYPSPLPHSATKREFFLLRFYKTNFFLQFFVPTLQKLTSLNFVKIKVRVRVVGPITGFVTTGSRVSRLQTTTRGGGGPGGPALLHGCSQPTVYWRTDSTSASTAIAAGSTALTAGHRHVTPSGGILRTDQWASLELQPTTSDIYVREALADLEYLVPR